jgi:hypothetical protein
MSAQEPGCEAQIAVGNEVARCRWLRDHTGPHQAEVTAFTNPGEDELITMADVMWE